MKRAQQLFFPITATRVFENLEDRTTLKIAPSD
jgi:hypothetical protein